MNFQPFTSTPRVAADPTPFSAPIPETNGTALIPKEPLFAETPKRTVTNGASGPPVYYPPETNDMFTKTPPDAPLLMVIHIKSEIISFLGFNSNLFMYSNNHIQCLWEVEPKAK